jgi:hypothetical protein
MRFGPKLHGKSFQTGMKKATVIPDQFISVIFSVVDPHQQGPGIFYWIRNTVSDPDPGRSYHEKIIKIRMYCNLAKTGHLKLLPTYYKNLLTFYLCQK